MLRRCCSLPKGTVREASKWVGCDDWRHAAFDSVSQPNQVIKPKHGLSDPSSRPVTATGASKMESKGRQRPNCEGETKSPMSVKGELF